MRQRHDVIFFNYLRNCQNFENFQLDAVEYQTELVANTVQQIRSMLATKRSAGVAPGVHLGEHATGTLPPRIRLPEETSPEVQNRGISGLTKNYLCPPKRPIII